MLLSRQRQCVQPVRLGTRRSTSRGRPSTDRERLRHLGRGKNLISLCVGLPGRFAEYCDHALAQMLHHSGVLVAARSWPPLEEMFRYESLPSTLDYIASALIETGAGHVVLSVREPDGGLYAALAELQTRFILALDDPRRVACAMILSSVREPRAVTRAVANSCALIMRFADLPGV